MPKTCASPRTLRRFVSTWLGPVAFVGAATAVWGCDEPASTEPEETSEVSAAPDSSAAAEPEASAEATAEPASEAEREPDAPAEAAPREDDAKPAPKKVTRRRVAPAPRRTRRSAQLDTESKSDEDSPDDSADDSGKSWQDEVAPPGSEVGGIQVELPDEDPWEK